MEVEPPPERRILLIEDEEAHAAIVVRAFERAGDAQLTVVSTVADAVEATGRSAFDLVIADWRLPDGEAFDLLTEKSKLPLLIMTSHGNESIAVRAIRSGALDYVVKSETTLLDMPHIADGAIRQWENVVARDLAQKQLRRSLDERTVLLKEVHHRVKNNLQVVCALLSMQIECMDERLPAVDAMREAYSRVLAMALVHEQIYQSETLGDLDFSEYIEDFSQRLFEAYCVDPSRIGIELDVHPVQLGLDAAVPFGLVLNELLSNSLKHAFRDGRQGVIRVLLRRTESRQVEFAVSDNGVGLPAGFRAEDTKSLGLQVVRTLARQLGAALFIGGDDGATFRLTWDPPPA
jgi:two-component sensor histidine kinase